jgi:hypothetical protein
VEGILLLHAINASLASFAAKFAFDLMGAALQPQLSCLRAISEWPLNGRKSLSMSRRSLT